MNNRHTILLVLICTLGYLSSKACHLSSLNLDTVIQSGSNYDIYVELCVGGGVGGGDGNTKMFQFAFYSQTTLNILSHTPSVESSIGSTYYGYIMPPDNYPAGAANIIYSENNFPNPPNNYFECVNSTSPCGSTPHQTCRQLVFTLDAMPDSMRVLSIEGESNPYGGCFPDADMAIYFAGSPPPLPVELSKFDVLPLGNGMVEARWQTASETNADHFELLRSLDGVHFQLVGTVPACGNCTHTNHYALADLPPARGRYYYRLMTVDLDGSVDYSPVRTVETGQTEGWRLVPNPVQSASQSLTLRGGPQTDTPSSFEALLFDMQGHQLQVIHFEAGPGRAWSCLLDDSLPPGMYLLKLPDFPESHLMVVVQR